MVFFTEILPTEIWFKIYKIEHAQNMKKVHDEIRDLNEEILIFSYGLCEKFSLLLAQMKIFFHHNVG